jgi:hypothetical protein
VWEGRKNKGHGVSYDRCTSDVERWENRLNGGGGCGCGSGCGGGGGGGGCSGGGGCNGCCVSTVTTAKKNYGEKAGSKAKRVREKRLTNS